MKSYFKSFVFAILCAALLAISAGSAAAFDAGSILYRNRLIWVSPTSGSDEIKGTDTKLLVENAMTLEFDVTYMLHPNFGLELIAGTTNHELSAFGEKGGSVGVLPPTLIAQYHFLPDGAVKPYAGVGLNYTIFYDTPKGISLKNSFGVAGQAGLDMNINEKWFFNFDVKYISMKTKVSSKDVMVDDLDVKINPLVIGAGVGTFF